MPSKKRVDHIVGMSKGKVLGSTEKGNYKLRYLHNLYIYMWNVKLNTKMKQCCSKTIIIIDSISYKNAIYLY